MATADDLRRLALALDGTTTAPHFDRTAFKVKRIYATLAADGLTANLKLDPGEQQMVCELQPSAFAKVPNAWGDQGWTTVTLSRIDVPDLSTALTTAWKGAAAKPRPQAKARRPR